MKTFEKSSGIRRIILIEAGTVYKNNKVFISV